MSVAVAVVGAATNALMHCQQIGFIPICAGLAQLDNVLQGRRRRKRRRREFISHKHFDTLCPQCCARVPTNFQLPSGYQRERKAN